MLLTPTDLAKYPFTPQAAEHVQKLDLRITELDQAEYGAIVERAEQRIQEAIENGVVSDRTTGYSMQRKNTKDDVEILSFPITVVMVVSISDQSLKRRYALAEAKHAYNLLKREDPHKLTAIAHVFNLHPRQVETHVKNPQTTTSEFLLSFVGYLKNISIFHESKWKLVNRRMQHGEVHVTKDEVARLIGEEVRAYIESKLNLKADLALPQDVVNRIEKLKQRHMSLKKMQEEQMPKETVIEAFPPCIKKLRKTALEKGHLSHIERFTLTSFLLNSGMSVDNVIECFRPTSDFSEKMTRYQVEHIAGGRGGGTKYVPPKCDTLSTHGVCPGGDEICEKAWRPLTYYKRKLAAVKPKTTQQ